ncbi:MAG: DUF1573 domain-containing protein [Verrucomicrobia bacterium]|nr:DUF1573 domain-containing protein [Verrucomicrobiota bacterium]
MNPVHDFGKANGGSVVNISYVFTNTGKAELEVTGVQPGCGCTVPGQWSRKVAPGQTGSIPLQFNTGSYSGPVQKSVTVTCNDPAHPTSILQLKGVVWKAVDVNPMYAIFNPVADSPTNEARTVRIVNNTDGPMTLSPPEVNNKSFTAELKTLKPDKEFELTIKTVPPFSSGTVQGMVTIKTTSTNAPTISVNAIAMVQQSIMVMPSQLMVPMGPLATSTKMGVTIRNNSPTNIVVSEPSVNVAGCDVNLQELQAGRVFNVIVTFPTGLEITPAQKAEVSLKTTHPQHPTIKVPIYQVPRPAQTPAAVPQPAQPRSTVPSAFPPPPAPPAPVKQAQR